MPAAPWSPTPGHRSCSEPTSSVTDSHHSEPSHRHLEQRLACDIHSPSVARQFLRSALDGQPEDVVEVAQLLVSELATNAVVHAHSDLLLRVDLNNSGVKVAVTDFGPGRPEPRRVRLDEAGGRGLLFVENLATDWGWTSDDSSKSVWFRIEIDALQAA